LVKTPVEIVDPGSSWRKFFGATSIFKGLIPIFLFCDALWKELSTEALKDRAGIQAEVSPAESWSNFD